MIRLADVRVARGGHDLLRGVSLEVRAGELVAIVGPNGAGKSTLLAVAAGDFAPSSGAVTFGERPLSSYDDLALARERAVVRQSSALSFAFRVIDVVLLGRSPRSSGHDSPRDVAIAERALDEVGLGSLRDRSFPTLSGGEQQRAHFARALAQVALGDEGKALLLDEPTAALDPAHQHRVLAIARRLAERGLAVLTVLHEPNLASRYADRVAVLSRGAVVADGAPAEVFVPELFRDVFGVDVAIAKAPWNEEQVAVLVRGPVDP